MRQVNINMHEQAIDALKDHPLHKPFVNGYKSGVGEVARQILYAELGLTDNGDGTLTKDPKALAKYKARKSSAKSKSSK